MIVVNRTLNGFAIGGAQFSYFSYIFFFAYRGGDGKNSRNKIVVVPFRSWVLHNVVVLGGSHRSNCTTNYDIIKEMTFILFHIKIIISILIRPHRTRHTTYTWNKEARKALCWHIFSIFILQPSFRREYGINLQAIESRIQRKKKIPISKNTDSS